MANISWGPAGGRISSSPTLPERLAKQYANMATNYSFDKRRKELDKKNKKEAKKLRKLEASNQPAGEADAEAAPTKEEAPEV